MLAQYEWRADLGEKRCQSITNLLTQQLGLCGIKGVTGVAFGRGIVDERAKNVLAWPPSVAERDMWFAPLGLCVSEPEPT